MAADMFLKLGDIAGDSADGVKAPPSKKEHKGEIDVLAWSWGMSQSASTHFGSGGGSGKVNVQDISITKRIDKSSPNLVKFCCQGKHFDKATLTVRKAGTEAPIEYFVIKMEDVLISSVQTGGAAAADQLTEQISLNFGSFDVIWTEQAKEGGAGASIPGGFNIAQNIIK
ncbi:MAG TPA: type VI secretion system tube protein Hcp [Polyangia bacterium]|nr:type VI secretion system tube protein Hcp [Polyangia bacterium]